MASKDPKTAGEWQEAVNGAEFFLLLDSCRQYGLIEGGPAVNADRCSAILERGRRRGIYPLSHEKLMEIYLPSLTQPDASTAA
jgi:hypothetical protein